MGIVSLPTVCDTNLSQRLSSDSNNNNNLREASFSSYLNHAEKEFVRKLGESTRDRSNPVITTTKEEDGDIEVFGAEKYFNGGMDMSPKPIKLRPKKQQYKAGENLDLKPKKPKSSLSGTPRSIRSESSCSQKALLQNVRKNPSRDKPKTSSQTKGFLYKCSCCYKKSVEVDEKQPTKTGFSFTFENPTPKAAEAKKLPLKQKIHLAEQKDRKSIEVFRSSPMKKTKNLEKRLSMLSWNDVVPRAGETKWFSNGDSDSESSSDLFEIRSLTGNPNSSLTRQSSDRTDSITPTTCYAPSEASIDWSVVTASAVDFSISSDDRRLSTTSPVRKISDIMKVPSYMNEVRENQRRRSNLLRVAGDGGLMNEKMISSEAQIRRRSEPFGRLTRFEADAKFIGLPHALATNSLSRQYSPRISNILYV